MSPRNYAFQPARAVMGKTRWYIIWYAPGANGEAWFRYRETFALNRIHHLPTRRRRADELVAKINFWLESGRSPWAFDELEANLVYTSKDGPALGHTPAKDAIKLALEIICAGRREDTRRSYESVYSIFLRWLEEKGLASMPVAKITNLQAMQYMDKRLKADRIGARTYNNQLNYLRGGWTILEQRGYVAINIWKSIPIKKAPAKKRRAFTPYEAQTVIKRVREQDELLFYALLLQYCCFIRPKELSRLRRRHVDLQRGIVEVPGREAKSHEERFPSIPRSFLSYFDAQFWDRIQPNEIVFSKGWVAGGTSSCGRNQMNNRHRRVLEDLLEEGALDNIEGLSWYSWKDTGISEALEQLPLIIVQDQAGHTSPDMTLKYRTKRGRNERFGNEFENKLL